MKLINCLMMKTDMQHQVLHRLLKSPHALILKELSSTSSCPVFIYFFVVFMMKERCVAQTQKLLLRGN